MLEGLLELVVGR